MKTRVLTIKHTSLTSLIILGMLLSVFLLPLHISFAQTNTTISKSTQTKNMSAEMDLLRALIAELQAKIVAMQKNNRSADDYVERKSNVKKPADTASTTPAKPDKPAKPEKPDKPDKPNKSEYSITAIANSNPPLINGKASEATTTTIIIEATDGEVVYTKENIKVTKGNWNHKVTEALDPGTYKAVVKIGGQPVAEKEFTIKQSAKTDPVVPPTQSTSTATTGEYRGYYSNGHNFILTKIISKADALVNCLKNAAANPTKKVYCTWNGEAIYGTKPTTLGTMPTKPSTTTTRSSSYYSPTRAGDVRGVSTTSPEQLLATILIGFIEIIESLE